MLFCGKLFLVLSAITILTQVVAFVNDFLVKGGKGGHWRAATRRVV